MKDNLFNKPVNDNNCKNQDHSFFSNIINYSLSKSFSFENSKEKKLDTNSKFKMKCI